MLTRFQSISASYDDAAAIDVTQKLYLWNISLDSEVPNTDSTKILQKETSNMIIKSNEPQVFFDLEYTKIKNVKLGN